MRILLIEDDCLLAEAIAEVLTAYGYVVDIANDGETGWYQAIEEEYSIILTDVMLPKLDGITLCQRFRAKGRTVPILIMTARNSSADIVMGLDAGADDYVVKPIDFTVLLARIRALLRRGPTKIKPILTWKDLQLNPSSHEVTYLDQTLLLTPTEFALLELLLRSGERVLSRGVIINNLWDLEHPPSEETVKSHIKALRKKLKQVGAPPDLIQSIRGVGYRLKRIE